MANRRTKESNKTEKTQLIRKDAAIVGVKYERLVNTGNYENQRYGVEVAVNDESPSRALHRARAFVDRQILLARTSPKELEKARTLVGAVDNVDGFEDPFDF